jgi:hypothetical protein
MSIKTKFIFTYVGGIVTGIILVFAFVFVKQKMGSNNIVWFDKPGQEIPSDEFRVMQVMHDGSAMALSTGLGSYGVIVVFPASEGEDFYDSQNIEIESDACVRQVGTYRYTTVNGMEKTVPIVDVFDK